MKKTILKIAALLLCVTIYSCSDNDHDPNNYVNNRLIEGTWVGMVADCDSAIYIFEKNKATYKYYALVQNLDTLKLEIDTNYGNYLLTDSKIILPQYENKTLEYRLANNGDSLYIKNPSIAIGLKRQ